jgi:predicted CXXCH cytochrome family protein
MSTGGTPGGRVRSGPRGWRDGALRAAAVLVLAIGALFFLGVRQRVEHDPRFCASSCHHDPPRGAAADLHARGHDGVACQDCHLTSLKTGMGLLWAASAPGARPPVHGATTAKGCTDCHEKRPAEWRLVEQTEGHRGHIGVKKVDCLSCHAPAMHAASAQPAGEAQSRSQVCLKCHKDQRIHAAGIAGAETCLSCHSYAVSRQVQAEPTTLACAKCHDRHTDLVASANGAPVRPMKDISDDVLHAGVACQLCHNPHGIERKVPQGQPSCAACHKFENFRVGNEDRSGPEGHRKCEGCHKQHLPRQTALQQCVNCHEKNAKGLLGDGVATRTTALRHTNCASCHVPHTWKAERSGCMTCHKQETQLFQTRSPPQHKACVDCHEVHGPPPSGAVCLKCHSGTKGKHVALAPERHKDCTSCHNPHAPRPEDTRSACAKCHTTEVTQVVRDGPERHARDSCFTCHKPHENPLPKPGVCGNCHADKAKAVLAAEPAKHHECTSCHERHVFRITDVIGACSRCHEALFDTANKPYARIPHQADCSKCHTFHGSPKVSQDRCLTCHEDVSRAFRPPNPKHADCASCHQSHTPASTAPARCRSCHTTQANVAASWPPESAHAKECNGCHQPHDAREKKACSECHAPEATSAMGSKHECKQCHPPHGTPPGTGAAWWSRCASCHQKKVESVKARGPTHQECKNCHQPHRFGLPACTSCHTDMASRGLHAAEKHASSCTSCHDPHVEAPPTRDQCLACHTDRRNHEPNAKACFTCHIFR